MDTINVSAWNDYFGNAAHQVLYSNGRYAHYSLDFQQAGLAKGSLNTIDTPGMQFTELYIEAGKPICLYDPTVIESAESVFILDGTVESQFAGSDILHFDKWQHNIQYNPDFSGTHIIHSPVFHACTVTYHTNYLNSIAETDSTGSLNLFSKCQQKKRRFLAANKGLGWHPRMGELLQAIQQCPFHGVTRYIFTESKLLELFVLQMEQVAAAQHTPASEQWSDADQEKLYAVKAYIMTSYLEPLSLQAIARKFQLNEFKLKKGYKHFFGTTVFAEVHRQRMQYARQLLADRVMNVTEAAYHIGYRDLSSFSFAFKKAFGCSPKNFAG